MAPTQPAKPKSNSIRSEITHLPAISTQRKIFRKTIRSITQVLLWLFADVRVEGLENAPHTGPGLVISNHLGDADALLVLTYSPAQFDWFVKAELRDFPVLGKLIDMYGVIWVHRGQPDRAALRAALQGLEQGRLVALAPEGRESLTGSLEEGTHGAAYLALKKDIPVYPVTFTGTTNKEVFKNLRNLKHTKMSITFGPSFTLESGDDRRIAVRSGTLKIMSRLAVQLPPELRGVYLAGTESIDGS
jgi:1-acyl-sn-glycerol-3-phosphate acyltransferase